MVPMRLWKAVEPLQVHVYFIASRPGGLSNKAMKIHRPPRAVCTFVLTIFAASLVRATTPNQLTDEEKAAGWKLLFDGKVTQGWRTFKTNSFPARGWVALPSKSSFQP